MVAQTDFITHIHKCAVLKLRIKKQRSCQALNLVNGICDFGVKYLNWSRIPKGQSVTSALLWNTKVVTDTYSEVVYKVFVDPYVP